MDTATGSDPLVTIRGSRAHELWAAGLWAGTARLGGAPTTGEILAGC